METISARVPEELKRELDEGEVNVSEVIREALQEEVKRLRRERLVREARELGGEFDVDRDDVVDSIRESRDER